LADIPLFVVLNSFQHPFCVLDRRRGWRGGPWNKFRVTIRDSRQGSKAGTW